MKRIKIIFGFLMVIVLAASVVSAAEVVQGKCVLYDKEAKAITLEEYDLNFDKENKYGKNTGNIVVLNVSKAQIGTNPEPGDIIRASYKINGTEKMAIKVMNVSKTDLMKK